MNWPRIATLSGLILGTLVPRIGIAETAVVPLSATNYLGLDLTLAASAFTTPVLRNILFGPTVDFLYRDKLSNYVDVRVDLAAEFYTGSATGLIPNDMMGQAGPRQTFRLREAYVDLHTEEKVLSAWVGAINQREFANPLLGGDIAFFGAMEKVEGNTDAGTLFVKVEQAVPPTSFSLLETASGGKTPSFLRAQVGDYLGDERATFLGLTAGYFQFDNLTTAQARQSLFWGNTVTGNANSAAFYLPFRGIEAGVHAGARLTARWQAVTQLNMLQNMAAPAGANQGYLGTLGANYRFDHAKLGFDLGYVYDQSDSSPAVFADGFLNSKNHQGYVVDVNYDEKGYALFLRAMQTRALVPQLYAGNDTAVVVGVKVHYDFLK